MLSICHCWVFCRIVVFIIGPSQISSFFSSILCSMHVRSDASSILPRWLANILCLLFWQITDMTEVVSIFIYILDGQQTRPCSKIHQGLLVLINRQNTLDVLSPYVLYIRNYIIRKQEGISERNTQPQIPINIHKYETYTKSEYIFWNVIKIPPVVVYGTQVK